MWASQPWSPSSVGGARFIRWVTLGVALAIILPAAHVEQRRSGAGDAFLQGQPFAAARTLGWLRPTRNDRMVCWGWRAECYVDAAIPPATRETINANQIYETALMPYFRSRFLADFARSRPDFVIDVVAPGSFELTNPETEEIASFPEFAKIIANDFDLVSQIDPSGRCPRLYVRRARLPGARQDPHCIREPCRDRVNCWPPGDGA